MFCADTAIYHKLQKCLEHAGESLYSALKRSDFDDSGSILKEDLIRVLKRIGFSNIEPHFADIVGKAGADEHDEMFDIATFASKITAECVK